MDIDPHPIKCRPPDPPRQALRAPQRGGGRWRVWESRLAKQHPVKGALGEQGTFVASVDVLRDLKSVERFIEVQAA